MKQLILILALGLSGCCGSGVIRTEAVESPLEKVMTRHDAYVNADVTLIPIQKKTYLATTELLRKTIAESKDPGSTK